MTEFFWMYTICSCILVWNPVSDTQVWIGTVVPLAYFISARKSLQSVSKVHILHFLAAAYIPSGFLQVIKTVDGQVLPTLVFEVRALLELCGERVKKLKRCCLPFHKHRSYKDISLPNQKKHAKTATNHQNNGQNFSFLYPFLFYPQFSF